MDPPVQGSQSEMLYVIRTTYFRKSCHEIAQEESKERKHVVKDSLSTHQKLVNKRFVSVRNLLTESFYYINGQALLHRETFMSSFLKILWRTRLAIQN